jgi:lipopolysaccharide transport system ATP-binding protein
MPRDLAISMQGVSKRYEVFGTQRGRLLHALWPSYRDGMQEIWALRDVDLEVRRGESVAVIGRNGGGKSTLLQILTGVLEATSGEVRVQGRISALLELGSGFNPEYTGRDNVLLNGLLLGLSREEILGRFDEIAAFAEIGDAIDRPVKTYSSGMLMRLAFAVQVLTEPEILVIDEALSVGDFFFQQKCFHHIRRLCERGTTLLFVSHDMATVRDMCSRAIYLRAGRAEFIGETREAIRRYMSEQGGAAAPESPARAALALAPGDELDTILGDAAWRRAPGGEGREGALIAVALYNEEGQPTTAFRMGGRMRAKVVFTPAQSGPAHVTLLIRNKYGQVVSSLGSSRLGLVPPDASEARCGIFDLQVSLSIEAGNYSVAFSMSRLTGPNVGENLDATGPIGPITIRWDYERETAPFLGMVGLDATGEFRVAVQRPLASPQEAP